MTDHIPDDAQPTLEPVAFQYRFRDDAGVWTKWMSCGRDHYDAITRYGEIGHCPAECRPLYAAKPPAAPVETDTKSAPVFKAPHNSGERPPSSDAAEAGAGTQCSAGNGDEAAVKLINQYLGMSDIDAEDVDYFRTVLRDTAPQRSAGSVEVLRKLVELYDGFWAGKVKDQAAAYYAMIKGKDKIWEEARAAVINEPQPPSMEETRQKAEDAIRTFCRSLGAGAVQMSHGEERIYYAGISLKALSVAVTMAVTRPPLGGEK